MAGRWMIDRLLDLSLGLRTSEWIDGEVWKEPRVISISILLWISKGTELSGAMVQDIVLCICLQPADVRVRMAHPDSIHTI